ncbi:uncharacterized protein LOC127709452 [Mytilus californianus]|uniref:uncharacterized protein LOC127709452 n=1 Tax=Mytilus californianus TaxID=6549 RepID=UPI002245C5D0|nr:uncharacterized protein LOC127709452 [Mytilus californianus]
MMCQRCCDKVHPKFPSAKDHTVIDIRDIGKYETESKPKQNFNKVVCGNHTTQNCCMFCKSCDQIVCPECIAKTHKRHDLIELCEGYDIKMAKIIKKRENIDSAIHSFTRGAEELRKIKYLEQVSCKRTRREIRSYEQTLSDAVKKHINKLLNEVDQKWEDFTKSIDKAEKKVNETCKKLTKQKDQVNDLLQSHDAEDVFFTPDSSAQSIPPIILDKTKFNHVPEFVPGDISIIPKLVGSLKRVGNPYNPVPIVIQWYSTDVKRCNNIISCPDGLFWINDKGSKQLQKVNLTATVMKVIYNFDIGVNDLSLMPNGDVLLCLLSNQSILKVIPVGTLEVRDSPYNVSPLWANCIHVTHENNVMVGVKDNGPVFPASGPRQVIVMDITGKQKQVFQYDNQNKPLFTLPVRIHSKKSNIIGVIDWINEECEGRIIVLNQEGFLKNVYMGHPKINSDDNPFKPSDILSLPSDNFIIADPTNHYLHILNSQGNILTFYNLVEIGIEFPYSMTFLGYLFIGGATIENEENVEVYKIDNFVW